MLFDVCYQASLSFSVKIGDTCERGGEENILLFVIIIFNMCVSARSKFTLFDPQIKIHPMFCIEPYCTWFEDEFRHECSAFDFSLDNECIEWVADVGIVFFFVENTDSDLNEAIFSSHIRALILKKITLQK